MWASRLISHARRWPASSQAERGAPAGPGRPRGVAGAHEEDVAPPGVRRVEDGARVGLVESGQKKEVGGLTELVVDVPVAQDLPRAGHDGKAVSDGGREPLSTLDEGGWIEWAHRRNNTTAKGERPMHVGMAAVFQNPGKARTDSEGYRNELR